MPKFNGWKVDRNNDTLDVMVNGTEVMALQDDSVTITKETTFSGDVIAHGMIYGGTGTKAELASNGAVTYSAASLLTGYIEDTSVTGAVTATTDTAVNILAAMPDNTVGTYFDVLIHNDGDQTITVAGGVGVTALGAALTIATNKAAIFRLYVASTTTMLMFRIHDAA